MKKNTLFIVCIMLGAVLCFTQYYSIGYLVAVITSSYILPKSNVFKTRFSISIVALLLLLATIPLVSLIIWVLGINSHPIYGFLGFLSLLILLCTSPTDSTVTRKITMFDKVDIAALLCAVIPAIIMLVSFFAFSSNKQASLFQLAAEGWDNGSHILMMQDTTKYDGYVYGHWEELKGDLVQKFNAYPQAWHLTTSTIVNGLGGEHFRPNQPLRTIFVYMSASVGWMMLTIYIFVVIASRIYASLMKKTLSWKELAPLIVISSALNSIVIYASLAHGFPNYIATIAYILAMVAMALQTLTSRALGPSLLLMIVFGTMSALTWFLVFPAIALTILLTILLHKASLKESVIATARNWRVILLLTCCLLLMLLQIIIFQKYSGISGGDQLNEGARINPFSSTVGVFVVNQILFGFISGVILLFTVIAPLQRKVRNMILIIVLPWIILSLGVYFYQNITVGYNSYYTSKLLGISLIVSGLVFTAISLICIRRVFPKSNLFTTTFVAIVATGLLLVGTGQSLNGVSKLFASNARTSYSVAQRIVESLPDAVDKNTYIVVLTGLVNNDGSSQDRHGMLEQRVLHQKLTCAYTITRPSDTDKTLEKSDNLEMYISRLGICADILAGRNKTLTVITSDETEGAVRSLNRANIKILSAHQ